MYVSMSACASTCGGQKRVWDSLKLELEVDVIPLTWVLGTELGSSRKATAALNCYLSNPLAHLSLAF